ncbi:MAG: hypothetical protein U1E14_11525 [Geminicoccaceae bacterium]
MEHGVANGPALLAALEHSGLGDVLRSSLWLYPAVETLHILGFALLVGGMAVLDGRIVTAPRRFDPEPWLAPCLSVARIGFALAVPMGFLLFAAEATAYVRNPVFLAKVGLILLALANIAWMHAGPLRRYRALGRSTGVLPELRTTAAVSLALWVLVLACGRLIAYV